jgi:very-long-chain (3R)-3-hydroxyacyl-CoA dehydratase
MLLFTALPVVKAGSLYSVYLPNVYNWSFDYYYAMCLFVFLYLPIFPQLYGHMISQRKKVLSGSKAKTE